MMKKKDRRNHWLKDIDNMIWKWSNTVKLNK